MLQCRPNEARAACVRPGGHLLNMHDSILPTNSFPLRGRFQSSFLREKSIDDSPFFLQTSRKETVFPKKSPSSSLPFLPPQTK